MKFLFIIAPLAAPIIFGCAATRLTTAPMRAQSPPSSSAWQGEGEGESIASARRNALGDLAGQLSVRIRQRCVERSEMLQINAEESIAIHSKCTTELRSVDDPVLGNWASLARCQTRPNSSGFNARCRLSRKALIGQLQTRQQPLWQRYLTLSESLMTTGDARSWTAKQQIFAGLHQEMWTALTAAQAVGLAQPRRATLMRRRAAKIGAQAQAMRDAREVLLSISGPGTDQSLVQALQQRFAQTLDQAGLRHQLSATCQTDGQVLLTLQPRPQCALNPLTGFSGCTVLVSGTLEVCGAKARRGVSARIGTFALPAGQESRLAQRLVSSEPKLVDAALQTLLNNEITLKH
jgi:hypothetical protein